MSRLDQIRSLLKDEPDDLFLNFGLAMELLTEGRLEEALQAFDRVIEIEADHVPAYQQKARALLEQGHKDQAARTLQAGIEAARRSGDNHAAEDMCKTLSALQVT